MPVDQVAECAARCARQLFPPPPVRQDESRQLLRGARAARAFLLGIQGMHCVPGCL